MWYKHIVVGESFMLRALQERAQKDYLEFLLKHEVELYITQKTLNSLHKFAVKKRGLLAADALLGYVHSFTTVLSEEPIGIITLGTPTSSDDITQEYDFLVLSSSQLVERILLEQCLLQQSEQHRWCRLSTTYRKKRLVLMASATPALVFIVGILTTSHPILLKGIATQEMVRNALITPFLPAPLQAGYVAYQFANSGIDGFFNFGNVESEQEESSEQLAH